MALYNRIFHTVLLATIVIYANPQVNDSRAAGSVAQIKAVDAAIRRQDFALASKLLVELASSGNAEAQYRLANLYRVGRGVPKNIVKAFILMNAAAAADHLEAQYSLGTMYLTGQGTVIDRSKAKRWLTIAAKRDHPFAQNKLAKLKTIAFSTTEKKALESVANADEYKAEQSQLAANNGWTVLMEAAWRGQTTLLSRIAMNSEIIDERDKEGKTALILAASNGHKDAVDTLIKAGASLDILDERGITALAHSVLAGHISILQSLLTAGSSSVSSTHSKSVPRPVRPMAEGASP